LGDRVSLNDTVEAIAAALEPLTGEIPELQIYPGFLTNPTPPAIDIYPAPLFQLGAGFGVANKRVWWMIRASVSEADIAAANHLLLRLLDVDDPASVEAAIVDVAVVDNDQGQVSGFETHPDRPGLIGCHWIVGVFL
jgi:hypothetical protein